MRITRAAPSSVFSSGLRFPILSIKSALDLPNLIWELAQIDERPDTLNFPLRIGDDPPAGVRREGDHRAGMGDTGHVAARSPDDARSVSRVS